MTFFQKQKHIIEYYKALSAKKIPEPKHSTQHTKIPKMDISQSKIRI